MEAPVNPWVWLFVLVVILGALGAGVWLVRQRPLAVYAWAARRSLVKAGLRQVRVATPTGSLSVFVGGSGPLLMLLHGAGDQAGTWAKVVPQLLPGHRLLIPDLAGHGDSAPKTGPIEAGAIFAGLEAVVGALAEGQPLTVMGNSLGGWMAMVLAQRHPDWVGRIIAVNGGALKGSSGSVNLLPRTRREARETMAQLRDPGSPAVPDLVLDDMIRRATDSPLLRFASTAATMDAWTLDEAQLQELKLPVFLLWGTADQLMPLGYAQRLANALPNAELITIPHCGHIPQQEAPERFLEAMAKALPTLRS
jgi:pimeloyl-ACP methyl ester carboxylesterase